MNILQFDHSICPRSRYKKRRLYAVKIATRRNGNGHNRGMKNAGYTPYKTRHVTETDTIEAWKRRLYVVKKLHVATETDTIEARINVAYTP